MAARLVRVAAMWLAATVLSNASAVAAEQQEPALPGLDAVLGQLRKGGLVIYFRHGATESSAANDAEADLARCETQRNLSAVGRAQFTEIGRAFRELRIGVDSVTSSPFCRCKDSAELAFARYAVSNELYFAINTPADQTKELGAALRRMLSTPPAKGRNAVIVAHTANLREAAGLWPKPEGAAYVFRPLAGGQFEAVARIAPEDWINTSRLAHRSH